MRTYCGGVPIRSVKEDQEPSMPSQFWSGLKDIGVGVLPDCASRASTPVPSTYDTLNASTVLSSRSIRSKLERIVSRSVVYFGAIRVEDVLGNKLDSREEKDMSISSQWPPKGTER